MMPDDQHPLQRQRVAAALAGHAAADAVEERDRVLTLRLVETTDRCFDRGFYTPGHVTASAFVVCPDPRRVLLHRHRRLARWLQLGGHDQGEYDPAVTALREAREESGSPSLVLLDGVLLDVDVHAIAAGRGEPAHLHHDLRFAVVTHDPGAASPARGESATLGWFTFRQAVVLLNEPGATRALRRLAALLDDGYPSCG